MSINLEPMPNSKHNRKPDYGIDAPGVRRGMFIASLCGVALAAIGAFVQVSDLFGSKDFPTLNATLTVLGVLVAAYGLYMGWYMTYSSRIGKLRTRDRLFDEVAELKPWRGSEIVLDVGCGRGLMVVGAAKRLQTGGQGLAIGIDVWRAEDQSANSPIAAQQNAYLEGVGDRIRIDSGDARSLPYADNSFDVVVSHWVVHNIEMASDRLIALDEMLRVLRPGGVIALADIAHLAQYQKHLRARGVSQLRFLDGGLEASVMGLLSGGSYRPQALLAVIP